MEYGCIYNNDENKSMIHNFIKKYQRPWKNFLNLKMFRWSKHLYEVSIETIINIHNRHENTKIALHIFTLKTRFHLYTFYIQTHNTTYTWITKMAMECVCFPLVDPRMANGPQRTNQPGQQQCCEDRKPKGALDLCKIVKRSRDNENNKHSEYECHLKGERRQNLINKIKMYLDDYDDR